MLRDNPELDLVVVVPGHPLLPDHVGRTLTIEMPDHRDAPARGRPWRMRAGRRW